MLRRLLILSLLLWLLPVFAAQAQAGDLLARVNNLRASRGLPPFTQNGALAAAAQAHAQWMANSGVISHNQPDGSGPRSRAMNAGYPNADVTENIYGGSQATVDAAWAFWVNSPLHLNSMINGRYSEIGVGVATGSVTTYVLVFGNPGGGSPFVPQSASARSSGGGGGGAPPQQPSYVKGLDASGNIMHEVQPGDTLGEIALIYGYSWGDLDYMRQLNGIEGNLLEIGSIFLVPPRDGTYTPTPGEPEDDSSATPEARQPHDEQPAADSPPTATPPPTDTPVPTPAGIATAAAMPEAIALPISVEAAPTETPSEGAVVAAVLTDAPEGVAVMAAAGGSTITRSAGSPWLVVGLIVQVGLLLLAGVEFARRSRRSGKRGR
jgi:hypothetical protein